MLNWRVKHNFIFILNIVLWKINLMYISHSVLSLFMHSSPLVKTESAFLMWIVRKRFENCSNLTVLFLTIKKLVVHYDIHSSKFPSYWREGKVSQDTLHTLKFTKGWTHSCNHSRSLFWVSNSSELCVFLLSFSHTGLFCRFTCVWLD